MHIFWFRQDLRLIDNPALFEAAKLGKILPIYILDDENAGTFKMGGASRWWLHHALESLNKSLGGKLNFFKGDAHAILKELASKHDIKSISWNRCYEPWRITRDRRIKESLTENIKIESFNGSLLWEPWQILKKDKTPYKVFTPFYRKGCLNAADPREPFPASPKINLCDMDASSLNLSDLNLLPEIKWDRQLEPHWNISEKGAQDRLKAFLNNDLNNYKKGRDFPALNSVSRLSPYLHFGQISPNQIWHAAHRKDPDNNREHFLSELGWREFSYHLLYHFPTLPTKNLQSKFDHFPWHKDMTALEKWQKGMTGYPIVDAGMRELWQTGYMHNRVRMIVGSFLVKNLLLHWHHGEKWFWDCLVDADLASNSASWQWIAGCGADAAPYFRIFNPILQGEKFDPDGEYTKRFVPELKDIPKKFLYKPWEAPDDVLKKAGIRLGKDYPKPIVDVKASRERALEAFQELKGLLIS